MEEIDAQDRITYWLMLLRGMRHSDVRANRAVLANDQHFVDFAAQTDMMEAHLGQMAADQASDQGVKDYAQSW